EHQARFGGLPDTRRFVPRHVPGNGDGTTVLFERTCSKLGRLQSLEGENLSRVSRGSCPSLEGRAVDREVLGPRYLSLSGAPSFLLRSPSAHRRARLALKANEYLKSSLGDRIRSGRC